jgi:site-specific DNA-methyltransferase (cytosine-N4-specific)
MNPKKTKSIQKSDLPFGSEFSPSQIDLARLLEFADKYGGRWQRFELAIRKKYFEAYDTTDYNRGKLANNCKLGMIAYGLIDRDANLTGFGRGLYNLRNEPEKLYRSLARHILLTLRGLEVIQTVEDIHTRGETINLIKLRHWLEERGIHFPRGGRHASSMRLWLGKAGVVTSPKWQVDYAQLERVLGMSVNEIECLSMFTPEQKTYLKTLANIGGSGPYLSNEVEKLATTTYGVRFDEKNLPKTVLYPLQDAGYITLERGTREAGRGAKPFFVTPTEILHADIIAPILETLDKQTLSDLRPLLRKSLTEILQDIESQERHIKGLALEALVFYLMRLIDLQYIATRLRGQTTGGAEVDLIFEGSRLLFSRWQIQCKNTKSVSLEDVAKEVGLTFQLNSNVVMVVSTGAIGVEARKYAAHVMKNSNIDIILIDRDDLEKIKINPIYISDALAREAKRAM